MKSRPSVHELYKNIKTGTDLVENGAVRIINPAAIAGDAVELGYQISDLQNIILVILAEIKPEYYIGNRPPEKAYASQIKGSDLFTFKWPCRKFGCEIYFKFCIREQIFHLVSLHQNR